MNREQLREIVSECEGDLGLIRQRLEAFFDSEEGRAALEAAPRCMVYNVDSAGEIRGELTSREMAVNLLMQEVDAWLG
ncbi:MAG TPA: hypothetical protein VN462_00225 [Negativicutes bacterium]|nr:hypothetical protein [Negativicutes bacterium]